MIKELLEQGHSEDEVVKILMEKFLISKVQAKFRIALVLGRTTGDVQAVDDDTDPPTIHAGQSDPPKAA